MPSARRGVRTGDGRANGLLLTARGDFISVTLVRMGLRSEYVSVASTESDAM